MPFTLPMPKLSPTMTDGVVAKWHKAVGDYCEADSLILDIGTDKATIEHHALDPGYIRHIFVQEGEKAAVGEVLAIFSEQKDEDISDFLIQKPVTEAQIPVSQEKNVLQQEKISHRIAASPLAKKLAKQRGISLENVKGSGPRGRIMSRDLIVASPSKIYKEGEIPLSPIRKVIAERLSFSKATIPHFYCSMHVDMTALVTLREEVKGTGHTLTINDFIVKAAAIALMKHSAIRATFIPERMSVCTQPHADVAVAVAVPGGLYTPIVLAAEEKSIHDISKEVKLLAEKAKSGKLLPHEYQGGAFTITNLGMFGIDEFFPIINPPQVAILGVGAAKDAPLVENGAIVLGKSLTLCLAADHRALDGTDVAAFLRTLKELLEKPMTLLI
jgi:pyruvate dehydrogenase E2 component (dihydrolipoamide acetyltransferase)